MSRRQAPKYRPPRDDWNGMRSNERGSVGRCPKTKKLQYETEKEARLVAKRFRKEFGPRLHQYKCPHCPHWHNGHDRKGKPKGRAYLQRKLQMESAIVKA